jgi:hypothetical protein
MGPLLIKPAGMMLFYTGADMFRYLDEQSFRYNYREDLDDSGRFEVALAQVIGKRLTWQKLTGKVPQTETCAN